MVAQRAVAQRQCDAAAAEARALIRIAGEVTSIWTQLILLLLPLTTTLLVLSRGYHTLKTGATRYSKIFKTCMTNFLKIQRHLHLCLG